MHMAEVNRIEIRFATRNLGREGPFSRHARTWDACDSDKESDMSTRRTIIAGCSILLLSVGTAVAGPCDMQQGRSADKDAGSGPASTGSQTTTGMANEKEHPPTSTMNRASGDVATSSQDTQRQMQGEPTAAQQAQGVKSEGKMTDKDC